MNSNEDIIQNEIEDLLRQKIGLNPESVGSRSILRAVNKGMRIGKMQRLSDYLEALQTSPELLASLIESIVVPETSFFRNRAAFVFLRQWIAQEWLQKTAYGALSSVPAGHPGRKLRVLSIPCSTGEEPYSLAITLLEEGLSLDDFHIDAVDISAVAIEKAKQGIYSPYAFRRRTYRSDDKYFDFAIPEGASGKRQTQRYFLKASVRNKISFSQGNVLDPALLDNRPPYDIVFCRNLLIYFDKDARARTAALLHRILRPKGLLFLGYAEAGLVNSTLYKAVPYPQTFAYRKRTDEEVEKQTAAMAALTHQTNRQKSSVRLSPVLSAASALRASSAGVHPVKLNLPEASPVKLALVEASLVAAELDKARTLADKGEIAQAVELCDRCLIAVPTEAQAYLLRGELSQAIEDYAAATECFEKALYLNPHLSEALTHLLLIKEENGQSTEAAVIRARLQRLEPSG